MSDFAIEIKNLVKKFDDFTLGPIDFAIPKGSIVGYIGQNGAGKSTTIKLLLGLLKKDSGEIKILDYDNPNSLELKDKIGVVFDDLLVPEEMTLVDLEKFCSRVYSKWDREFFYQLIKKFNLFLLDFIQDENHTILISSHILSDLEKVADYIAFINDGKVLFVEPKDELKENYGICTLSNEEVKNLDEEAIIGRRIHSFGQELLVKRNLVPDGIRLQKPSIEDIMIYFVKGGKR